MSESRPVVGVERDRSLLRGAALKIIRHVLDQPLRNAKGARRDWLAPPAISSFQRLEPLGFGIKDDDWWLFRPSECTPDLVWPLDTGMISENSGSESGGMVMSRTYTISPKQARGYATRFSPFMVRHDHAQMEGGELMNAAGLYAWAGGGWTDAQNHKNAMDMRDRAQPALATSLALRQRYEWAVSLGLENSPSVRFATDPTGIKDVFAVRDLPEGRDRREALLNWVTDHWRESRHDPDMETYVRRHLRGSTRFSWRNMTAEILPAKFDLDQRDAAIAGRDIMRREGTDKRARAAVAKATQGSGA